MKLIDWRNHGYGMDLMRNAKCGNPFVGNYYFFWEGEWERDGVYNL